MMMLLLLFVMGGVTSFVSTHTGGGALVAIPAMIWLGFDPRSSVAAARFAGLTSMVAGVRQFHQSGKIDYPIAIRGAVVSSVGCAIGAIALFELDTIWLERALSALILLLAVLSFVRVRPPEHLSRKRRWLGDVLFFISGAVGGFAGGQAVLLTYTFMLIFGKTMSESIGTRKIAGIAIGVVAMIFYGFGGIVDIAPSLALATGSWIGAHFGTSYGLKKGDRWLGRIFTVVAIVLAVKLLFA